MDVRLTDQALNHNKYQSFNRHGLDGVSSNATKDVISDLTGELRWRKEKYDFLNKHDASFEQAVIKIHYAAFIHK